jgi:hypothetical protein
MVADVCARGCRRDVRRCGPPRLPSPPPPPLHQAVPQPPPHPPCSARYALTPLTALLHSCCFSTRQKPKLEAQSTDSNPPLTAGTPSELIGEEHSSSL